MKNRILIIDGDLAILDALERELKSEGFSVMCVEKPDFVYGHIKNFLPDLIIMEIVHESLDGRILCDQIKKEPEFGGIPVVLITSLSHQEIAEIDCHADAIIGKPYSIKNILLTIHNLKY